MELYDWELNIAKKVASLAANLYHLDMDRASNG